MYERILITGGAGFVGSRVGMALRRQYPEAAITALDNLRRRGSELSLPALKASGITFAHGDVRCPEDLAEAAVAPDLIIECSAEPSVQAGYGSSPEYLIHTNLTGCFHCLELARRSKARFLFLSTSRVYPIRAINELRFREDASRFTLLDEQATPGASAQGISEDFPLEGTRSLYGMTKLSAELMIAEYAEAYGIPSIINRCGVLAGPGQMGKTDQGVVTLWVAAHYFRRNLWYIGFGGEGKQVRDLLHIDDLCDLVVDQCARFDRFAGHTLNVGGSRAVSVSLRELTDYCRLISGNEITIGSHPENRVADIRIFLTDYTRITQLAGWQPRRGVEQIVSDIHGWIAENESTLRSILSPGN